jgi:hypothetical protein
MDDSHLDLLPQLKIFCFCCCSLCCFLLLKATQQINLIQSRLVLVGQRNCGDDKKYNRNTIGLNGTKLKLTTAYSITLNNEGRFLLRNNSSVGRSNQARKQINTQHHTFYVTVNNKKHNTWHKKILKISKIFLSLSCFFFFCRFLSGLLGNNGMHNKNALLQVIFL